ncbi:MAG: RNase adapter RapZ [Deltaproteobacteria bacterium]|nr:RNase adapter RapZ [Deltaproteobacteria bacterium]
MISTRIVVVTGLSGSGKTTALRALEDQGYFCIDNLPSKFLRPVVKMAEDSGGEIRRVAFGVDIRSRDSLDSYPGIFKELEKDGADISVIFLDCSDEVLARRFKETRRPHPLADHSGDISMGIAEERTRLESLKDRADQVIDTTRLTVHDLSRLITEAVRGEDFKRHMGITVLSFGFKFGLPSEADLVFDVRFLPNPFFKEGLKRGTGEDAEVSSYALGNPTGAGFIMWIGRFMDFLLPCYEIEGRRSLTIAFGCTGGHHRSVAVAKTIADNLKDQGFIVALRHRDINK